MANENWQSLGDKLRNYRPAVDADAAWQGVLYRRNTGPQPLSLRRLLGWKLAEIGLIVVGLIVFSWSAPVASESVKPTDSSTLVQARQELTPAPSTALSAEKEEATAIQKPSNPQGSAKRALSPSVGRVAEMKLSVGAPRGARSINAEASPPTRRTNIHTEKPAPSSATTRLDNPEEAASSVARLRATGPLAPLSVSLPQRPITAKTYTPPLISKIGSASLPRSATPVALEISGGIGQTTGSRFAPFAGLQLRYFAGARSSLVLGAAYQRVDGMNLHWHQAEYHKDYGYPTGNAVDRWLDSYGAWEYSIDYRRRLAGRLSLQTGIQLTILQERGLREQVQGSDFFLGSSRRSLVDRDFGLRVGLDYRLTRHFALFARYLHGLGDISPNHLYEQQTIHRHGGWRVGLRLMPFQVNY